MLHFYPAKEIVHSGQSPQSRDWRLGSELGTQSNCQLQPWHSGSRSESLAGGAACLSVRRCGQCGLSGSHGAATEERRHGAGTHCQVPSQSHWLRRQAWTIMVVSADGVQLPQAQ